MTFASSEVLYRYSAYFSLFTAMATTGVLLGMALAFGFGALFLLSSLVVL